MWDAVLTILKTGHETGDSGFSCAVVILDIIEQVIYPAEVDRSLPFITSECPENLPKIPKRFERSEEICGKSEHIVSIMVARGSCIRVDILGL